MHQDDRAPSKWKAPTIDAGSHSANRKIRGSVHKILPVIESWVPFLDNIFTSINIEGSSVKVIEAEAFVLRGLVAAQAS